MLELKDIRKSYTVGDFTQVALDDVSISFRDNEFVAVLGPSGSGKTTMLNIVGGLDRYDSGALIIDGIDTSKYTDRDWDTYRNNRIGFVFQSYNLIPHQSVLSNVELALTLSGVSKAERRARALAALDEVGLAEHVDKRPSQLSGGQMQRVAIARALINDPEILLADEPTGALDSVTSTQIMGLLSDIAKDRLVVMVTHNPELADAYATRTVDLRDGRVEADSDPFDPSTKKDDAKAPVRTSMSFFTAIALSFNNLMTKKGRTLMTAFAGSIGIIGIAAILSLANGVNDYIRGIEEDTLSVYPLTVQSTGMDMTVLLSASAEMGQEIGDSPTNILGEGEVAEAQMMSRMFGSVGSNDLAALKRFFDADGGNINEYTSLIQYSYNVTPQIFTVNSADETRQVNPDPTFAALGMGTSNPMASAMQTDAFNEMVDDTTLVEQQYDVLAGDWPRAYNEVVLVLTPTGKVSDYLLFTMGIRDGEQLDAMVKAFMNEEESEVDIGGPLVVTYDQLMDVTFKMVPSSSFFKFDETYQVWADHSDDKAFVSQLVEQGEDLVISGIVQAKSSTTAAALTPGFYYTPELTYHLIDLASDSEVVQAQLKTPRVNVLTGRTFVEEEEDARGGFDMDKLFQIDEEAIQQAFQFDESVLALDVSQLNFAAMSLPPMNLDASAFPELALGDIMGDLELGLDNIDFQEIIDKIDLSDLDLEIDVEAAARLGDQLLTGFMAFCGASLESDPGDLPGVLDCLTAEGSFEAFLETDEGKTIVEGFESLTQDVESSIQAVQEELTKQIVEAITDAISKQLQANSAAMEAQMQQVMSSYMTQVMAVMTKQIEAQLMPALQAQIAGAIGDAMSSLADNMASAMSVDPEVFQGAFKFNLTEDELAAVVMGMMSSQTSSFEANMAKLGWANLAKPSSIDIYPLDFESKDAVIGILDQYNQDAIDAGQDGKVITYTDLVGVLMSSVTTIINVVSYVLVAFVAISLVVSSIMIGVITYISVLERKKEIGILRSIGASKKDIKRVFNAETLIVGLVAGLMGIGVTLLLTLPVNAFVNAKWGIYPVAILPWQAGVILVLISMGLTYIAGLIPSSAASRKDPVEALRSE